MKLRPITLLAGLAVVAVLGAGVAVWRAQDSRTGDQRVDQPTVLPLALGMTTAAAPDAAGPALARLDRVTYRRGPGLVEPTGPARAGVAEAVAADPAALGRLASAFGIHGQPASEPGALVITDRSGARLGLRSDPGSPWTYAADPAGAGMSVCASASGPGSSSGSGSGVVEPGQDSSPTSTPPELQPPTPAPCSVPVAPGGVPDGPTAGALARKLLAAAGIEVTGARVTSTADAYSATVRLSPSVDGGMAIEGLDTVVTFGAEGHVVSADGWLGRPRLVAAYPLVGVDAAIDRLQAGRDLLGPVPLATPAVGPTESGVPSPPLVSEPPGATPFGTEPTIPQPRDVVVTITGATVVLVAVPGTDGALWFVPAYRLVGDDQSTNAVLAVDDRLVAWGPPPTTVPLGLSSDPSSGSTSGSAPAGASTPSPGGPAGG